MDVGDAHRSTAAATGSPRRPCRAPIGSAPWAATATGGTPSGSTKSRIERSCGARSQSTSMSGCTSPRLIRTESTNWTSPISPPRIEFPDPPHGGRVAVRVIAHQHQAAVLGQIGQLLRVGERRGQRLLDQTCLPASRAATHQVEVGGGGCRDRHRVRRRDPRAPARRMSWPRRSCNGRARPAPAARRDRTTTPVGARGWRAQPGRGSAPSSRRRSTASPMGDMISASPCSRRR